MEKFDFIEKLEDSFNKHMEHILKCPLCSSRLAELVRDAQKHVPNLLKREDNHE